MLVPPGKVSFLHENDHVHVTIESTTGSSNIYKVDQTLKILRDNGSLYSKLHLAYLHGLTSFCLPDPFTSYTGTEQSLSILRGAAVRSFHHLTEKELKILNSIQAITPRRAYSFKQSKAAQTVHWDSQLPVLSQHPSYHINVQQIFQQIEFAILFYPDVAINHHNLNSPDAELVFRDAARNSAFRTSSFGSENFSEGVDTRYRSRDLELDSERSGRALTVSTMLFHRNPSLHCLPSNHGDLASHILNKLGVINNISNSGLDELPADVLEYDGKYLTDHLSHWAGLWCWLHRKSQNMAMSIIEPFQIMMWFTTMAFGAQADNNMIHTAAYMFFIAEVRDVQIPSAQRLRLQLGKSFNTNKLRALIAPFVFRDDQYPEPNLSTRPREHAHARTARARRAQRKNKDKAVDELLVQLENQWPCLIPVEPQGQSRQFIKSHLKLKRAMSVISIEMEHWYRNRQFTRYLEKIENAIIIQPVVNLSIQVFNFEDPPYAMIVRKAFISPKELFSSTPPRLLPEPPRLPPSSLLTRSNLSSLLQSLQGRARSTYEQNYARELGESMRDLEDHGRSKDSVLRFSQDLVKHRLDDHLRKAKRHASQLLDEIQSCMERASDSQRLAMINYHCQRLCPIFLLQQLSQNGWGNSACGWRCLPEAWRPWILAFGVALTEIQRATRLTNAVNTQNDLIRELQNEGHTNWDPAQYPESLLLEIESGILIREVQEEIASQMR